jgi:hypothetical protein
MVTVTIIFLTRKEKAAKNIIKVKPSNNKKNHLERREPSK